ncbi:unnamed protein product [Brassica rapa subsp. trilocularis]
MIWEIDHIEKSLVKKIPEDMTKTFSLLHNKEIRLKENHRTRLSYIYISVEDSREFPSRVDEITQSNSRRTSGFMVFYGEIEDEEEEGSRN